MQELMEKSSVSQPYGKMKSVRILAMIPQGLPEETKDVFNSDARMTKQTPAEAGPITMASIRSCFFGSAHSGHQVLD